MSKLTLPVWRLQTQKFSLKEQMFLAKRLSFLMNAGVSLSESVAVLATQMHAKQHKIIMHAILQDVLSGQTLSRSISKFPQVFSKSGVHMLAIGELSGSLSKNLEYVAEELQKQHALRRKVIGACIYPALITTATLGITLFLTVYLFPKIMPVFQSLNVPLPWSTRLMIAMSSFITQWGVWIVCLIGLSIWVCVFALHRSVLLQTYAEYALLRLPLFGNLVRLYNMASISRTLGLLLASGVQLSEALPVTADATRNRIYANECRNLAEVVRRGEPMSSHLLRKPLLFPDIMGHMVMVGERSGTLSHTLVYMAGMFDAEVDEFTKNISTLIEPVLMICMGLVVGFIAIAIITPIYGITQNLHA